MRTAAILPVKRFVLAKQRLQDSVADPLRAQLARAMVRDVLAALAQATGIERTILVTCERSLASDAREHGALLLSDTADAGQSAAVSIGVGHALAAGIERVLCVPGDCPALDHAELDRLLEAAAHGAGGGEGTGGATRRQVVIVPDRHGSGTNGLLLSPPDVIAPSFGPGSYARHRALAHAAGAACRTEHPPSLLLDIDTGEDLAALLRAPLAELAPGGIAPGSRTRALLGQGEAKHLLSTSTSG
jgi:2-phospho-L-lactate guanylyltransferase